MSRRPDADDHQDDPVDSRDTDAFGRAAPLDDLSGLPPEVRARVPLAIERAAAKVSRIVDAPGVDRLLRAARGARTASQRTVWIHRTVSAWMQPFGNVAACKRGCAHCCHLPVAITSSEARLLSQASGRAVAQPLEAIAVASLEDPEASERAMGLASRRGLGPCPFLTSQGSCSVYEQRPVACRAHANLDDDDLLCRLIDDAAVPVSYVDARRIWLMHLAAHRNDLLADVRDFFPGCATSEAAPH